MAILIVALGHHARNSASDQHGVSFAELYGMKLPQAQLEMAMRLLEPSAGGVEMNLRADGFSQPVDPLHLARSWCSLDSLDAS